METFLLQDLQTLETKRLILRKLRKDDIQDMFEYGSNDEVTKYVSWYTYQSITDAQLFLDHILQQYEDGSGAFWGIEDKETNKLIGTIDFVAWNRKHRKAEIGYILSQDYWGKGLMTEAAQAVIQFGFEKMNLVRIEARCLLENIGSEKVMQKAGMQYEGTLRKSMLLKEKHRDIKLYSILKDDIL
ncbi:GNAT family N-acetyltransferase [Bacillus suaedaesalsae]|uniref:GNAT family N-acetyltransferase n=1 Tax=Bacillus suaedaesalsae TaxID=2810349 RepID=A0ABS2DJY8_9BACI|nr:GNAT family protein [Bacillus suaedaesalsae]MBM6618815.1 GNAT family N-acetyltransferase [Bacillus suaedaesalsae]